MFRNVKSKKGARKAKESNKEINYKKQELEEALEKVECLRRQINSIKNDLEQRVGTIEFEEPEYKGN